MPQDNDGDPPGNPWGARNSSPPDLSQIAARCLRPYKTRLPGGNPSVFFSLLSIFVVGVLTWSTFYTGPSDSVAVVQRWGKHIKNVTPSLYFKPSLGIDAFSVVPFKRQLKQEFCFSSFGATRGIFIRNA